MIRPLTGAVCRKPQLVPGELVSMLAVSKRWTPISWRVLLGVLFLQRAVQLEQRLCMLPGLVDRLERGVKVADVGCGCVCCLIPCCSCRL